METNKPLPEELGEMVELAKDLWKYLLAIEPKPAWHELIERGTKLGLKLPR